MGGANKAMIKLADQTIISHTLAVLRPLFNKIFLAGADVSAEYMKYLVKVNDRFHDKGPLAGIDAALNATTTEFLFVFAGDMPDLSADLIKREVEYMINNTCNILVPRSGKGIEPLHSIIGIKVAEDLEKYLSSGNTPSVRDFYKTQETHFFDLYEEEADRHPFRNINSPSDIDS